MEPAPKLEGPPSLDVVEAGAREAGRAVARLLKTAGYSVEGVEELSAATVAARHAPRALVVSFALTGALRGSFALVISEEGARALAVSLVGGAGDQLSKRQLGALTELGNIGASAYLNGVAKQLRATCLPSVPSLLIDESARAVEAALGKSEHVQLARVVLGRHAVDLALVATSFR